MGRATLGGMTVEQWWIAYLAVGVAMAAWIWHTAAEDMQKTVGEVPMPPRMGAAVMAVWICLVATFWPLAAVTMAVSAVRSRR